MRHIEKHIRNASGDAFNMHRRLNGDRVLCGRAARSVCSTGGVIPLEDTCKLCEERLAKAVAARTTLVSTLMAHLIEETGVSFDVEHEKVVIRDGAGVGYVNQTAFDLGRFGVAWDTPVKVSDNAWAYALEPYFYRKHGPRNFERTSCNL